MTQESDAAEWSTRLAAGIAQEVRRQRQAKGWSAQQLADRTAEVGMPIQRSVIANLESGRRTTVNVAEVLVLAAALGVAPGVLIFPVGRTQLVEYVPGRIAEPIWAFEWVAGRAFQDAETTESFPGTALGLVRAHVDLTKQLMTALRSRDAEQEAFARTVELYGDSARVHREALSAMRTLQAEMERVSSELEGEGGPTAREELEKLQDLHGMHFAQTDEHVADARQFRYAQERLRHVEREVKDLEAALVDVRGKIREQGLVPPLLFSRIMYLDPEATVALDDASARRKLAAAEITSTSVAAPDGSREMEFVADGQSNMPFIPGGQEFLSEVTPYIKQAVKEALREWQEGN